MTKGRWSESNKCERMSADLKSVLLDSNARCRSEVKQPSESRCVRQLINFSRSREINDRSRRRAAADILSSLHRNEFVALKGPTTRASVAARLIFVKTIFLKLLNNMVIALS